MAGFNYQDFSDYMKRFNNFRLSYETWITSFLLQQGLKFINKVKVRTPVDTGDLRNHWEIQSIRRYSDMISVVFVNPMYYATFVEYGHAKPYKAGAQPGSKDWVDGYFMMTVSLQEIEDKMPKEYERSFAAWVADLQI